MESLGRSQGQKPEGPQASRVFGRGSPYNVIPLSSWTSKERFLSANGLPREYLGQYTGHKPYILVELNPNILVRDEERIHCIHIRCIQFTYIMHSEYLYSLHCIHAFTNYSPSSKPLHFTNVEGKMRQQFRGQKLYNHSQHSSQYLL